jgi:hypothetical protein
MISRFICFLHSSTHALGYLPPPSSHLHVLKQVTQARPHFFSTRLNLSRRQHKSIITRIPQLHRHTKRRLRNLERVIDTITTNLVNSVANGSAGEDSSVDSLDGSNGTVSQSLVLSGVGDGAGTCISVRVHPKLGVGVDVHIELNSLSSSNAVEVCLQSLGLDTVTGGGALVVVRTRRRAGSATLVPVVGPIPVDVTTNAAGCRGGLAVFAPHAVAGLSVGEAIGVDDGEDVEVVLVLVTGDRGISGAEELVCGVLNDPVIESTNS